MTVRRLIVAALCVLAGGLVFSGAPAFAAFSLHPFKGSFTAGGLSSFVNVQSIAVDESTGDVYVYDAGGEGSIYKFNAAGEPAAFSGLEATAHPDVIEGVGAPGSKSRSEIAVDNSSGPAKGDIYVAYKGASHASVYGSTGLPLAGGELTGEGTPAEGGEPCGVAVDPSGHVYVAFASGFVNKYTPATNPAVNADYTSSLAGLAANAGQQICNIAVDSQESVYVMPVLKPHPLFKYGVAQFGSPSAEGTPIAEEGHGSLAVDQSSLGDDLYIDEGHDFAEYEFSGAPSLLAKFAELGPGALTGETLNSFGIAVSGSTGEIYVSNAEAETVEIFGPSRAQAPSVIASVSGVTSTGAMLRAQINPSLADTAYHFEYGLQAGSYTASLPAGDVGSGFTEVSVQEHLRGLQPGTVYHYRVVASNSQGTTLGADEVFTTQAVGGSFALPDGRVFEMVSPLDKNGADIIGGDAEGLGVPVNLTQAAPGGGSVVYGSLGSFAGPLGNPYGGEYRSVRGVGGWSIENVTPPLTSGSYVTEPVYQAFSSDLSRGVFVTSAFGRAGGEYNRVLTPDAAPGYRDLYMRNSVDGSLQALLTNANLAEAGNPSLIQEGKPVGIEFEGASPDLAHVVVGEVPYRTLTANGGPLYEWTAGQFQLVGHGYLARSGAPRTVSLDGSTVFWSDSRENASSPHDLYVTKNIGSAQMSSVLIAPGANYQTASTSGSVVIFTEGDLFEYDVASGQTTDLAPGGGSVLGASEDASYIYFVANGVLAAGAIAGQPNVYLWHAGSVTLIPSVSSSGAGVVSVSRVTPDGRHLAFVSEASLTGYDNRDVTSGLPDREVYVYDADTGALVCASCNPSGARPVGSSTLPLETRAGATGSIGSYESRALSVDGGRVFFESRDALVAGDVNGVEDVYEWEAEGRGSCRSSGGCVFLVSGGTSSDPSQFIDASASGDDVFFTTGAQLVPGDTDQLVDIYDARVNGGFPQPAAAACSGTGCQNAGSVAPVFGTPATLSFSGVGNFPEVSPGGASHAKKKHKAKKKKRAARRGKKRGVSAKTGKARSRGRK
jgi:hypothetical protein